MAKNETRPITNARTINKMRCIVGLIICSIVIIVTLVSLTLNIINYYNDEQPESGIGTLRMYTTISNIIATLGAATCIPFQIDGLRKNKYKLPRWIVDVVYVGTVGVALTLTIAIAMIGPMQGYYYAMLEKSNLFMHTITPIFVSILFTIAISDCHLTFKRSLITMVPTFIYACLYFIFVFITHTWRDHYHLTEVMPWPLAFIAILAITLLVSQILRFIHNYTNKIVEGNIIKYYKESPDYEFDTITNAISKLAKEEAQYYQEGDDLYIPVDIIKLLSERYKTSTLPLDIQYDIYLENYLSAIHKNEETGIYEKTDK